MATSTSNTPMPAPTSTLVRKSVAGEALVVGWSAVSDTVQVVTVRWPRRHDFYVVGARYSPLLLTESMRQALALLTHAAHQTPLSHRLGWETLGSTVVPEALDVGSAPAEIRLTITHTEFRRRRLGTAHITSQVTASRDGHPLGTADLRYATYPPAIYERLRGRYADAAQAFARALPPIPAVPAARVGRTADRDVVLSPTEHPHRWQLRVDTSHRVLFDHPHDHVPGMVMLEAASQAAHLQAMPGAVDTVAFDSRFLRYVEYDRPCLITAESLAPDEAGRTRVKVCAEQDGQPVFHGTVTAQPRFRPSARPGRR
jgi:2-oxo-3-(phosphooxy)propyl 3-oxoalkanoate synthase